MNRDVLDEANATTGQSGDSSSDGASDTPNLVPEAQPRNILAGRIELLEKIGEGGMGAVWRGHHLKLDRPVAVKVLDETLQLREDGRERFIREARALALLDHRNVVRIHDCDQLADGKLFLCMELLDGETLRELIRGQGRLDALEVIDIGLQVCDAIEAAHQRGILHRDLTPSNIIRLRDAGRTIKIIDWGLCKYLDLFYARSAPKYGAPPGSRLVTPSGLRFGTPEYMAPELISRENRGTPSFCTDVYALGVVLYELLTGRHPFNNSKHKPGETRQPRPIRELLPDFDYQDLESALRAALRQDPEDRIPTMTEMREALDLARECLLAQRNEPVKVAPTTTRGASATRLKLISTTTDAPSDVALRSPPRGRLTLLPTLLLLLGVGVGIGGTLAAQQLGGASEPLVTTLEHTRARAAEQRAEQCEASDASATNLVAERPPSQAKERPLEPAAPAAEPAAQPSVLAAAATPPAPRPRATPTPARTFAQAMARLEPKVRDCARSSGVTEAPTTVQVRRRDGALDQVKVLKLSKQHPFAVCVEAIVRGSALPASPHPIEDFTYFR